jgi:hypothetical protein
MAQNTVSRLWQFSFLQLKVGGLGFMQQSFHLQSNPYLMEWSHSFAEIIVKVKGFVFCKQLELQNGSRWITALSLGLCTKKSKSFKKQIDDSK